MSGERIRVLVVDDQALVRAGFRMILETEPGLEVVGEAADGERAVDLAAEQAPDVVLMDVRMPGVDGIEATRQLLGEEGATSKVVMLTTFDMDEYVYEALRAGASGFLLKDVPPEQLVAGIRAVASGDAPLPVADGDEPDFEPDADAADPVTLEPDALPLCEPEAAALPVGDEPEVVPVAARSWEKSTDEAVCWQLEDATVVGW